MDAECEDVQGDLFSRREKRWSMNSQRLEEIVAELMKPISDARRSFDTDLSALLEEYLTEAGLHALEAEEESLSPAAPNFAELALLLQQSACIYGRKVDFLYQHVLTVSDSLHNNTLGETTTREEEEEGEGSARRRRRGAGRGEPFAPLVLTGGAAPRAEPPRRPPPTLPRAYLQLEPPRRAADSPAALLDCYVVRPLRDGFLVEPLTGARPDTEARVPPLPPPSPPPWSPPPPPLAASTPLPPARLKVERMHRKRKNDVPMDDIVAGSLRLVIDEELRKRLSLPVEFALPQEWVTGVVGERRARLLRLRESLPAVDEPFSGWSAADARPERTSPRLSDSEDDGFFELSSEGSADEAAEARGAPDVRALAGRVLGALPPSRPLPWAALLSGAAPGDVPRLFLATLFLANAGNVRVERGAALAPGDFGLRALSRDHSLYHKEIETHR